MWPAHLQYDGDDDYGGGFFQVYARHNISLDQRHGNQFFDRVAEAVTPTKLASACFIGNNYKDLITFMCSDERTVPMMSTHDKTCIDKVSWSARHLRGDTFMEEPWEPF